MEDSWSKGTFDTFSRATELSVNCGSLTVLLLSVLPLPRAGSPGILSLVFLGNLTCKVPFYHFCSFLAL